MNVYAYKILFTNLEREEVKKKEREESKTFEPKPKKPVTGFFL